MLNLTRAEITALYPVIGAKLYRGGIEVLRLNLSPWLQKPRVIKRGEVTRLTRKSLNNLAFLASVNSEMFNSMLTLTYGVNWPGSGRGVKRHLNNFLTRLRGVYGEVDYLWFLEFQERGAPHVHLLLSLGSPSEGELKWVANCWANISCDGQDWQYTSIEFYRGRYRKKYELTTIGACQFAHCQSDVWEGVKVRDGAARYVVKYATKPKQKVVPKEFRDVGRWWGASRSVRLGDYELVTGSEGQIREYLKLKGRDMTGFDMLPKLVYVPK